MILHRNRMNNTESVFFPFIEETEERELCNMAMCTDKSKLGKTVRQVEASTRISIAVFNQSYT